ncbi:conserved membrane hypothetical protein [Candidatus Roizmanbacteria bacterium]|nr:conserved membrane hypothetical protein [Candidatus Roizmanbacteria bacterium]
MNLLIILLITASYFFGAKAILENKYFPNIYSRIIWLLLSINGLVSVILLKNNPSVILYALLGFLGSLLIFILSLKKSKKIFGPIEFISTIFLFLSLGFWIFTKLPFLNLSIGLIISFIGGIPTFVQVIKNPNDEDILFWLFFALGSFITLLDSDRSNISGYLFPLYFLVTNSAMTLLCLRRYLKK